jgi:hypothetical protein
VADEKEVENDDPEIEAIRQISRIMRVLPTAARRRLIRWLQDRFDDSAHEETKAWLTPPGGYPIVRKHGRP